MEILVADGVRYNKKFSDLESIDKIIDLTVQNHDLNNDWSKIGNFKNLKKLTILNCLVDGYHFYKNLTDLKKLSLITVDQSCNFLNHSLSKKSNLKLNSLKKFVYICKGNDQLNFDFDDDFKDNHKSGKLNFLSFPNFPDSLTSLEEIEIRNYENYLKEDFDNGSPFQDKIIYSLDFNMISRLKKLTNISLTEDKEKILKNEKMVEKIFSFPNDQRVKINNFFVKDIKSELSKTKILYLDFDKSKIDYDEIFDLNIKRGDNENNLEIHYPSHSFHGISQRVKVIFLGAEQININLGQLIDYCATYDDFFDDVLQRLEEYKIKKYVFKIENNHSIDRFNMRYLVEYIKTCKNKGIEIEIIFQNTDSSKDLKDKYREYFFLFYFLYLNLEKKLKYKLSSNLDYKFLKDLIDEFIKDFKTIMVFEDQSNSPSFNKMNNIEFPIVDWPYTGDFFYTLELSLEHESLKKNKKDESLDDLLNEKLHWGYIDLLENEVKENPGEQIAFVKNEFLDSASKIVFPKLETISFQKIRPLFNEKKWEKYEELKYKKFKFPKSIKSKSIKRLDIHDHYIFDLSLLKDFENLEEFNFSGHLNDNDKNWNIFPELKKLKVLNLTVGFPFLTEHFTTFKNIEKCINLEKIILSIGYTTKRDESRWSSNDVDVSELSELKKLYHLELQDFPQDKIKNLNNLSNLKTLEITNPFMITEEYGADDGTIHKPLNDKDFTFLKSSKKLENLKIYFPRFGLARINIDFSSFIKMINPALKKLDLLLALDPNQEKNAHILLETMLSHFENLEDIQLRIEEIGYPEILYDKRKKNGLQKAEIEIEKKVKNPVIIDIKKLNKFKSLERIELNFHSRLGTKIENLKYLSNFDKIDLHIEIHRFNRDELEKVFYSIASKREIFMYEHNKKRFELKNKKFKFELINYNKLDAQNKKDYDLIEEEENVKTENILINNTKIYDLLFKEDLV